MAVLPTRKLADPLQQSRAEQGLCYRCGGIRADQQYRLCDGCREYMREAVASSRATHGRTENRSVEEQKIYSFGGALSSQIMQRRQKAAR